MKKVFVAFVCFCVIPAAVCARTDGKTLKKITVTVDAAGYARSGAIASLDLTRYAPGGKAVAVRELTPGGAIPCVSQVGERDGATTLWWRVEGDMAPQETRTFEVEAVAQPSARRETVMKIQWDADDPIFLTRNSTPLFAYHTQMSRPGHGVDPVFARSGYIHPVWSPAGSVLTEFGPADHSHHYGVWSAWTRAGFQGVPYDMWNVILKQGMVRFDTVRRTQAGDLFAELAVSHDHVIFQEQPERTYNGVDEVVRITPKKQITILDESLDLRAWDAGDKRFVWDFDSELTPSAGDPVVMEPYRYGGFVWRATRDFRAENVRMLSSEGLERAAIDGTQARWLLVCGSTEKGDCGFLIMSHPDNHGHPEPLRTWDAKQNRGRGDVMANFAPAKFAEWRLEPGGRYRLRYRVVTFDGGMTADQAERLWLEFAHPVSVAVK